MKLKLLLFSIVVICGCGGPELEYVSINCPEENNREKLFLESLFEEKGELWRFGLRLVSSNGHGQIQPSIFIELCAVEEYAGTFGDILISRTFFAPLSPCEWTILS